MDQQVEAVDSRSPELHGEQVAETEDEKWRLPIYTCGTVKGN